MRVLVTTDTVGGVWTYVRELVLGLVRHGAEVALVSFGNIPTSPQTDWMVGIRGIEFYPTAFRLEWMQEAEQDNAASAEYLLGVIKDFRPDILHLNQFCYGNLPVDIPRIVVAHSDVISWWMAVHGGEPPEERWLNWYKKTVTEGLKGATAVVAPSRWMLEAIESIYRPACEKHVIYNGRTPSLFNPHTEKQDFALSVGRLWDAGKHIDLITRAKLNSKVIVAGSVDHPDAAVLERAGVNSDSTTVEIDGPKSEGQLRELYGRAAIYIATSQYEPFGLSPLEAAFSRCAIVANDIPSLREVWGDTACYFRHNDSESLAENVDRLMNESALRSMYSVLAYTRARMRYSSGRMVDEYLALYSTMAPAGALAA